MEEYQHEDDKAKRKRKAKERKQKQRERETAAHQAASAVATCRGASSSYDSQQLPFHHSPSVESPVELDEHDDAELARALAYSLGDYSLCTT